MDNGYGESVNQTDTTICKYLVRLSSHCPNGVAASREQRRGLTPNFIVHCPLSIVNCYRSGFVTAFAVPETTLPAVFTIPPAVLPIALGTAHPPKPTRVAESVTITTIRISAFTDKSPSVTLTSTPTGY